MSIPSSVLNTNIASMIAQRNLGAAQTRLAESVERLSSGQRINRAKDDAAGMAVAAVVDTQVRVADTAHRNVNDAISMVQTAEGALQEANAMLSRIKELATQGANDSMSRDQYYFLVQEMRQLMEELVNTAERTTFNGNKLLGSGPNATRQVTTTTTTTQTTGVAQNVFTAIDSSGLLTGMTGTIRVIAEVTGGTIKLDSVPAGVNATITGYGNATNGTATSIAFEGSVADVTTALGQLKAQRTGSGAAQVELDAIPAITSGNPWAYNPDNGHYYELIKTRLPWHDALTEASTQQRNGINGYLVTISSQSENNLVTSLLYTSGETTEVWHALSDASVEGIWVYAAGPELGTSIGNLQWSGWQPGFTPNDGPVPFDVNDFASIYPSGTYAGVWNDTSADMAPGGVNLYPNIPQPNYVVEYGGMPGDNPTVTPRSRSVTLNPQQTITVPVTVTTTEPAPVEYNAWDFLSGAGTGDAIRLEGIPIWDTASAAAERNMGQGYAGGAVQVGALNALYQRILWLSDPANGPLETGQGYDIFSKNAQGISGAPEQEIFDKDGSLISSLTKSLNDLVDDSMLQINAHRSYFGAYAGRMEHNIANLATQSENLTAAVSRIRDTDYGFETAKLTRTQILQQAATAMLAQANAMPNVVLGLLKQA